MAGCTACIVLTYVRLGQCANIGEQLAGKGGLRSNWSIVARRSLRRLCAIVASTIGISLVFYFRTSVLAVMRLKVEGNLTTWTSRTRTPKGNKANCFFYFVQSVKIASRGYCTSLDLRTHGNALVYVPRAYQPASCTQGVDVGATSVSF